MDYEEMMEALEEGIVACPKCGNTLELDGVCHCGGRSPLIDAGMI